MATMVKIEFPAMVMLSLHTQAAATHAIRTGAADPPHRDEEGRAGRRLR